MALPYSLLCTLGFLVLAALQSHCSQSPHPPQPPSPLALNYLYVKPSSGGGSCPNQSLAAAVPCLTLDEYAESPSQYFTSNQRVLFLSGTHDLSHSLTITSEYNITFAPYSDDYAIICNSEPFITISFEDIWNLTLTSMSLTDCRGLDFSNVTGLKIEGLTLHEVGYVYLANVFGDSYISKGMNPRFQLLPVTLCIHYNISRSSSNLREGARLLLEESFFENCIIDIDIQSFDGSSFDCNVIINKSHFQGGFGYTRISSHQNSNLILNVTDSVFSENLGSSLFVSNESPNSSFNLALENVTFNGSSSHEACLECGFEACLGEPALAAVGDTSMFVSLKNVTFYGYRMRDNCTSSYIGYAMFTSSALFLYGPLTVSISNCTFSGNSGSTALTSVGASLTIADDVSFINNTGMRGGAMAFYGDSHITLNNGAKVLFQNNNALDVGGAIYVSLSTYMFVAVQCFITEDSSKNVTLNFVSNRAANGGDDIYGAMLSRCIVNSWSYESGSSYIKAVSNFSDPDDMTSITSEPMGVCLCDNSTVTCSAEYEPIQRSVYPGQQFNVSAALVGDMNGAIGGIIYAQVYSGSAKFGDNLQSVQQSQLRQCTILHYSLKSHKQPSNEKITLNPTAHSKGAVNCTSTVYPMMYYTCIAMEVSLLPCPLGFQLDNDSLQCGCNSELAHINVTCNITAMEFTTYGTVWIGKNNQSSDNMYYSEYCPFNYCKNDETVNIELNDTHLNQDAQCAFDRSGILCGGCPPNYSLALGSNKCLSDSHCSDSYLSLLIAFALAGIALVFFIKIFNLTITKGTINGLIFYANIIGVDPALFFPANNAFQDNVLIIISWLNLDLGTETCLYKGMDGYSKVWLQFVFPAYVLLLAFLIVVVSHYSVTASRIFGNNSVPVLATLIILSYSKILRTITSAVAYVPLQSLNGETEYVWQYDGNMEFMGPKHAPLCIFSYIVLVFVGLPFTMVLLCIQWIQRLTHIRGLRWIAKWIPFFDAFTGPFKSKHRYWIGVMLITRFVFIVIYAASGQTRVPTELAFVVFSSAVLLIGVGHVYKSVFLTILECACLLNLSVLATGTFFVSDIRGNQEALAGTSVIITSLLFAAVVVYHGIVQLRQPIKYIWRKIKRTTDEEHELLQSGNHNVHVRARVQQPLHDSSQFQYREPLFEQLDTNN